MKRTYLYGQISLLLSILAFISSCNGQANSIVLESNNPALAINQKTDSPIAGQLDELISTFAEYEKFNGSVLVAHKGKIVYKKGFGLANMEWKVPNQADTKHRLASIGNQFTAMLIVQLVSENKLDLQAPISTYLPDYPKKNGDIITVHHLLTHSSGTPDYAAFPNYRNLERERYRPAQIVDLFADLPLEFTPGQRYKYSNSGYMLLDLIIEKLTGKPYAEVVQNKILTPLKMSNTGFDNQKTIVKNRALGYYKSFGTYHNVNYLDTSLVYAAGDLYSTVEDLYRWDQALYTEKLLPKKYLDLLFAKHIPAGGRMYAYGCFIDDLPGKAKDRVQTISYRDEMEGARTLITRIPANKSLIVLLSNTASAALYEMTFAINKILHEQAYDFPEISIANSLLKVIEKDGIMEGLSYYEEVKGSSGYYLNEDEMILVGYDLLNADRAQAAASVFKLSIEAFPKSFNRYDNSEEALMVLESKAEAFENLKQSIVLNPGDQSCLRILKGLGVN